MHISDKPVREAFYYTAAICFLSEAIWQGSFIALGLLSWLIARLLHEANERRGGT